MNMLTDQDDFAEQADRAARVFGAFRCLEELVSSHGPCGSIDPEPLAYMLALLNEQIEKVLPLERCSNRPRPMNDVE